MANDLTPFRAESRFELTTFLEGRSSAWGLFEDRFGNVRTRFRVDMHGFWQDGLFLLEEEFTYDDGKRETRVWRVTGAGSGAFTATCDECVGVARGASDHDSIRMTYRFRLKMQAREITVHFDDRIHRLDERSAFNRATMSKWGIRLGDVLLFFQRDVTAGQHTEAA